MKNLFLIGSIIALLLIPGCSDKDEQNKVNNTSISTTTSNIISDSIGKSPNTTIQSTSSDINNDGLKEKISLILVNNVLQLNIDNQIYEFDNLKYNEKDFNDKPSINFISSTGDQKLVLVHVSYKILGHEGLHRAYAFDYINGKVNKVWGSNPKPNKIITSYINNKFSINVPEYNFIGDVEITEDKLKMAYNEYSKEELLSINEDQVLIDDAEFLGVKDYDNDSFTEIFTRNPIYHYKTNIHIADLYIIFKANDNKLEIQKLFLLNKNSMEGSIATELLNKTFINSSEDFVYNGLKMSKENLDECIEQLSKQSIIKKVEDKIYINFK